MEGDIRITGPQLLLAFTGLCGVVSAIWLLLRQQFQGRIDDLKQTIKDNDARALETLKNARENWSQEMRLSRETWQAEARQTREATSDEARAAREETNKWRDLSLRLLDGQKESNAINNRLADNIERAVDRLDAARGRGD